VTLGDAEIVIDGLAARRGGGAAYITTQIATRLAFASGVRRVILVTRSGSLVARNVTESDRLRLIEVRGHEIADLPVRVLWELVQLPRVMRGRQALLTLSGILPRHFDVRVVSFLANPVPFEEQGWANTLRRLAIRRTSRRASAVLVPTVAMSRLVSGVIGRNASVVPLGVDRAVFSPGDGDGRGVLYVADFYQHKRHDLLIDAWAQLGAPRPPLTLIGDPLVDSNHAARIGELIEASRCLGEITVLSHVSVDRLVHEYRSAAVVVIPSVHESFCLPLIEAQACGIPVIARGLRTLREVGGVGATYVDSDDPLAWTAAISDVLGDRDSRTSHSAAGLVNSASYTWERTVSALRDRLVDD